MLTPSEEQAATSAAADQAVAVAVESYRAELRGRRLTGPQRELQRRAERLARALVRVEERRQGRPR